MAGKSADAFRTISEVADWLDRPAHVLRFWESKFNQIKPVKRAGGRRYYRPEDMLLLGGIKKLLHDDGLTIKGAQKVLREQGVRFVSALSQPLDDDNATLVIDAVVVPLERRVDTSSALGSDAEQAVPAAILTKFSDSDALPEDEGFDDADISILQMDEPEPAALPPAKEKAEEMTEAADMSTPALESSSPPLSPIPSEAANTPDAPDQVAPPVPLGADLPPLPDVDAIQPQPGILSRIAARREPFPAAHHAALGPILARLDELAARMAAGRKS